MRDKTWTTKTFHPVSLETSNLIAHFIEKEKLVNDQNREAFFAWKLSRNNFGVIEQVLTVSELVRGVASYYQ